MNDTPQTKLLYDRLRQILPAPHLLTEAGACLPYSYDNSRRQTVPLAVCLPTDSEQVQAIVRLCNELSIPITARGRGTGTTGAAVPDAHGIVLSLERMNRILEVEPENRLMVVQPGVTNQAVQEAAGQHGFFWAPDPTSSAFCSVGGNLAYNSAGPRAVKYGTARENTLGLTAVTGAGDLIRTGVRTSKGVVGYDLTRLLIGSEGGLAIITEATLKLLPMATAKKTLQAVYQDIDSAARAVSSIMAQPVTPCALEFMDAAAIDMIRGYGSYKLPEKAGAILMIEVDGTPAEIESSAAVIEQAARNPGLREIIIANTTQEVEQLWSLRKALSPALRKIAPKKINEDVVVPVAFIPELITGLQQLSQQHRITIVNFGHAGNGNIHVNLLLNPDDPQEMARGHECLDEVFDLVLRLQGTLSGEHGVGLEKQAYISREIDTPTLHVMKQIKQAFDPNNILNPGKLFVG